MTTSILRPSALLLALGLAAAGPLTVSAEAQTTDASADSSDSAWPRDFLSGTTTYSVYQPQVDNWKGNQLNLRAAVAVRDTGAAQPAFGVVWLSARTEVDKTNRMVALEGLRITKASFPSAPDRKAGWQAALQRLLPESCRSIDLDRLETDLAVQQQIQEGSVQPLANTPPRLIFSTVPAILVPIDGTPVLRSAVAGWQRVINTRPLLVQGGGTWYLHVFDGWMRATALGGPWSVDRSPPVALATIMQSATAGNQVDLLDGAPADSTQPAPSLASGPAPAINITTQPAELVVTDGAPDYVPIQGTGLLYVENTTGRVFKSIADNQSYVLVSGRWFRAPSVEGPWSYIPGRELPADFAKIPDQSPMENAKASVPGTAQAREAAIANSIPQTAAVNRAGTTLDPAPTIDGDPQFGPIAGTTLRYVLNASIPIIQTDPTGFYAVQNGVWFVAASVTGPWAVAANVPAEIYSIPPSSPLHYVTFVQIYDATPDVVYVGYTPGYFGTVLDPDGVVVYGTGYYYTPWIGADWFGYPWSYGFGASARWTPWTGWGFGYGFGWSWGHGVGMAWGGWGWGPRPWWGPSSWWWGEHRGLASGERRGGWAGTTGDVYARWDRNRVVDHNGIRAETWGESPRSSRYGVAYNSHTGIVGIGQRVPVRNINNFNRPTTIRASQPVNGNGAERLRPVTAAPPARAVSPTRSREDLYATPGGQVLRRAPGGEWQQPTAGGWQHAASPPPSVQRAPEARNLGAQRAQGFRSIGGSRGGIGGAAGGFRGGARTGGGRR